MDSIKRFCILLIVVFSFSGCASKPDLPRFVWPAPPDQPKLEFVGNFYSDYDLAMAKGMEKIAIFLGSSPEYVFKTPFGIVSDGKGRVFISDTHVHNVWVVDFNTGSMGPFSRLSLFESPAGMALDAAGNLYVADIDKGRVIKLSQDGRLILSIEDKLLRRPAYLAFSPHNGTLYVSDPLSHRILIFDPQSGEKIGQFGDRGKDMGHFHSPQGLTFGPDGKLYVADTLNARIQVLEPDGRFISAFGERGDRPWQFESPKDLSFDSDGNLYVIDARSSVIKTFRPNGELLLVTGAGGASANPFGFGAPKSIYIDLQDRIYVSEALGKRFSIWQYMNKAYLQRKPYTEADRKKLIKYMEEVASQKANISD